MHLLDFIIFFPLAMALLCLLFKRLAPVLALLATLVIALAGLRIFFLEATASTMLSLQSLPFSNSVYFAATIFALLITIYSIGFMKTPRLGEYYAYLLISIACAAGAFFAADFITLLLYWGALGIPLYLLIGIGENSDGGAAKKALLMVGGADAFMILGVGLIWAITGTVRLAPFHLPLTSWPTIIAFLALLAGAFAKAGVMPLHSWIPDSAKSAPASVMAFLPASLDKLLGIYLLTRLCYDVFMVTQGSGISIMLMAIGSITIVGAVMAALIQHDLKKLLSFHAVSQVGYMVLGIGTGTAIGVAGGIFHMFNHAIYKSTLFLCAGAVEKQTGTTELEELGGLGKTMPLTFIAFLIAAAAISGLPPFNGFASKWLIYSALTQLTDQGGWWIIWLGAAMFGSAFTLASFVKVVHAVFLGQGSVYAGKVKEVSPWLWLPMLILAATCVAFGVFAFALPIKYLITPVLGPVPWIGYWTPGLATLLLATGLLIGLFIYLLGQSSGSKSRPAFYGGEILPLEEIKVTGNDFYDSVKRIGFLTVAYAWGERRYFDLYEQLVRFVAWLNVILAWLYQLLPLKFMPWLIKKPFFVIGFVVVWTATELLMEIFSYGFGIRELWTALMALPPLGFSYFLAVNLRRSYLNND